MLGTSEQTAKISKTGFAKIGHTAVSKPQWVGFSSEQIWKLGKKNWYPCLGFFWPEPLPQSLNTLRKLKDELTDLHKRLK